MSLSDLVIPRPIIYLIAAATAIGGLWWCVSTYNGWVSEAAVAKENARWEQKFNELETQARATRAAIEKANSLAKDAVEKEKQGAKYAQAKYQRAIAQIKETARQRDSAMLNASELDDKLRELAKPINSSRSCETGRTSAYAERIGKLLAEAESDIAESIGAAKEATDRLAVCEAGIRALKKEN